MLARGHVDEDRFVLHALFEQRDQHASRVRRKRVVMQADHRQRSWSCGAADHSAAVCGASGAIRTQAAFGICAYRKTSQRSEEHTSELQSLMRISYAVFCLKKKKTKKYNTIH